jgi:hypothetical protein
MKKTFIALFFTFVSTIFVLAATKEELEQQSRVGMTFDDLIELYGQPNTSGKDRAYPDGFPKTMRVLEKIGGYEASEMKFTGMETPRFVNFSLPKFTITPFSISLDRIKNKDFNKEQTVGLDVIPIQGVNFQLDDMKELFKFLTKCDKKLIRKSPIEQDPAVYYTPGNQYLVIYWFQDNHTAIRILDLKLAHQATDILSSEDIQNKSRLGMTLDELCDLYGAPNTQDKDNAYPKGLPKQLCIMGPSKWGWQGIDPPDMAFMDMTTDRIWHFSLDKMTISPFCLPLWAIRNENVNKDRPVGLNVTPTQGITFTRNDMNDIFRALTKSDKPLICHTSVKNPEVYYSSDNRYIVMFWPKVENGIRIFDRVRALKSLEQKPLESKKQTSNSLTEGL